jgi:hypothetical protein
VIDDYRTLPSEARWQPLGAGNECLLQRVENPRFAPTGETLFPRDIAACDGGAKNRFTKTCTLTVVSKKQNSRNTSQQ